MNTFYLEGPGGLPGVQQVPQGSSVHTRKPFSFDGGASVTGLNSTYPVINANAATLTLTAAQSGSIVLLNRAAGVVVTLPAPTAGLWYRFVEVVSVTSNNYKIITDASSTFILGQLDVTVSTGVAKLFFADGSTIRAITSNGSTTGGLAGGQFDLTCLTATMWNTEGTINGSGTVATPFATS